MTRFIHPQIKCFFWWDRKMPVEQVWMKTPRNQVTEQVTGRMLLSRCHHHEARLCTWNKSLVHSQSLGKSTAGSQAVLSPTHSCQALSLLRSWTPSAAWDFLTTAYFKSSSAAMEFTTSTFFQTKAWARVLHLLRRMKTKARSNRNWFTTLPVARQTAKKKKGKETKATSQSKTSHKAVWQI